MGLTARLSNTKQLFCALLLTDGESSYMGELMASLG